MSADRIFITTGNPSDEAAATASRADVATISSTVRMPYSRNSSLASTSLRAPPPASSFRAGAAARDARTGTESNGLT